MRNHGQISHSREPGEEHTVQYYVPTLDMRHGLSIISRRCRNVESQRIRGKRPSEAAEATGPPNRIWWSLESLLRIFTYPFGRTVYAHLCPSAVHLVLSPIHSNSSSEGVYAQEQDEQRTNDLLR